MTVILKTRIDRRARSPAYADLRRVYDFVEPVDPRAAARAVRPIFNRIERIPAQPRLGERRPSDRDAPKIRQSRVAMSNGSFREVARRICRPLLLLL